MISRDCRSLDAWTSINGYVLDITDWIPIHPGGNVIKKSLGKEITDEWWNIRAHNISIVQNIFPKYIIGKLKVK
jgi:cytochrome b involved in lipid metabolism